MTAPKLPEPLLAARVALLVAWCARVEDASVYGERRYILGSGAELLDETRTARRLADLPKPLRIDALAETGALRIHATPLLPGSAELRAFEEERSTGDLLPALTPEEDPDHPGIALCGAGSVLHISPAVREAFNRDYWMGVPAFVGADLPGSPLVADLAMTEEELQGIAEVMVLGRSGPDGAYAPIRPRRTEKDTG